MFWLVTFYWTGRSLNTYDGGKGRTARRYDDEPTAKRDAKNAVESGRADFAIVAPVPD